MTVRSSKIYIEKLLPTTQKSAEFAIPTTFRSSPVNKYQNDMPCSLTRACGKEACMSVEFSLF